MPEDSGYRLRTGYILEKRYRIDRVLGEGGFGITYQATDLKLARPVAIKEYYPHGYAARDTAHTANVTVSGPSGSNVYFVWKENFLREARILADCWRIPQIVSAWDFFEENDTAYIVMEFLDGITLKDYVKKNGVMDGRELAQLVEPLLGSLEAIHKKNLLHRDISPENIMLMPDHTLTLYDFGAARTYDLEEGRSMSVVLKHGYAPPEQYRKHGEQGPWTDIYALCATLYYCLTGTAPEGAIDRMFDEEKTVRPSASGRATPVDREFEDIVLKGLRIDREKRFRSAALMRDAVRAYLSGPRPAHDPSGDTVIIQEPVPMPAPKKEPEPKREGDTVLIRDPGAEPKKEPRPEPKGGPKEEPKGGPGPGPKEEPKGGPKPELKPEPESGLMPGPKEEPESGPKPEPKAGPKEEPRPEPKPEPKKEPRPEPKGGPGQGSKARPPADPGPKRDPEPKRGPKKRGRALPIALIVAAIVLAAGAAIWWGLGRGGSNGGEDSGGADANGSGAIAVPSITSWAGSTAPASGRGPAVTTPPPAVTTPPPAVTPTPVPVPVWYCENGHACTEEKCAVCDDYWTYDAKWICAACGQENNGLFCENCGQRRPAYSFTYVCECGQDNLLTNVFCENCGARNPNAAGWQCANCGNVNGDDLLFCEECGKAR